MVVAALTSVVREVALEFVRPEVPAGLIRFTLQVGTVTPTHELATIERMVCAGSDDQSRGSHIRPVLELTCKKECSGDINTLPVDACCVGAALGNLAGPEVPAPLIRLAKEEVEVVLADELPVIVNRIGSREERVDKAVR